MLRKLLFTLVAICFILNTNAQTRILSILAKENTVYLGTNNGFYSNQNKMYDWKLTSTNLPDDLYLNHMVIHQSIIFSADYTKGLYFSKDLGVTWEKVNTFPADFVKIGCVYANESEIYVSDFDKGIIYSSDLGLTWKTINLLSWLNSSNVTPIVEESEKLSKKDQLLKKINKNDKNKTDEKIIDPKKTINEVVTCGTDILAAVTSQVPGGGLYKSSDKGQTWSEASADLKNENINSIQKYDKKLYVITPGLEGGVYCSENSGENWTKLAKSELRWVTSFCANSKTLFIGNYYDGICTSTDSGLTWKKIDGLVLRAEQTIDYLEATNEGLYAGTSDGIIFFTEENGVWKIKNNGLISKKIGSTSYSNIGSQNGVSLGAEKYVDEIVFEVVNTNPYSVSVNIKLQFECESISGLGSVTIQKQEIVWRISVAANSTKSYDTDAAACSVGACSDKTKSWQVSTWTVN
jgi:photosystem II stability/assembly factor-like uncharacterized protein